ncbi:MAG: cupin domain-containing protein [Blastocatellia bacterium]|nr:cupin domain-containing protein [Blastocatellia bacterium]
MESILVPTLQKFSAEKMTKINIFETEHFFCDIYCFEPGQSQKLHTHSDADKVYFVLKGEGKFQVGEEVENLGPGYAILARSGLIHGVENSSSQQLVVLVFMSPNPNIKKV